MVYSNFLVNMRKTQRQNPRMRIAGAAFDLFYKKGYNATGVNDILKKSKAYKKSYYRYFRDKTDIGKLYLKEKEDYYLTFIQNLSARHTDFESFWNLWISLLKREIKKKNYNGCPIANFSVQNSSEFRSQLNSFLSSWNRVLSQYLKKSIYKRKKFSATRVPELSKKIMLMYEGALITFVMSNDKAFIDYLRDEVFFLAERYLE